jgi:hypothetical protein
MDTDYDKNFEVIKILLEKYPSYKLITCLPKYNETLEKKAISF